MNFLAHFALSGNNPQLAIGNFLGDFTRKANYADFTAEVQKGIRLHRFIDSQTDRHALVKDAVDLVKKEQGRYSSVVVDIYFDHLLAKDFSKYHGDSLKGFSAWVYHLLNENKSLLPSRAFRVAHYMRQMDWLNSYATRLGLEQSLIGMSRRATNENSMANGLITFLRYESELDAIFQDFYPALQADVKRWLNP